MKLFATLAAVLLVTGLNAQTIPEKVQQGITLFNAGNLEGAAQVLNQVIQENPQHGPARFILGQIAIERNQWKEAEEHLTIAVVSNPRRPQVVWQLYGKLQLLLHNYPEARRSFEQSLRQSPDFLPAYLGRAQSALFLNETASAIPDLERASAESAEAVLLFAETLIYLNRDQEARKHLADFQFREAANKMAAKLLLYSIHKEAASQQELRKSVSENLGRPESYFALGISELKNNNKEAAIRLFQIAFQLNDQNPVALLFLKQIAPGKTMERFRIPHAEVVKRVSAAQDALNQQKPEQARVLAERILEDRPMHIQARLMLIEAFEKEKKYWEAFPYYRTILESVHGFPSVEARFALLAQKMEAHELAECHIRKALEI
ncbi:MAG: tetratricopeptide repeat protein, partial [Acidobacteriota bacterium]